MLLGAVKKYVEDRAFGFLIRDDGQHDLFFHISSCRGFVPYVGLRVQFDVGQRNGKAIAVNVQPLDPGHHVDSDPPLDRGVARTLGMSDR
jgi:cold shock CspA family protein